MVVINGKRYKGNNVTMTNNQLYIDGELVEQEGDEKVINISIEGNISSLDIDYCDKIEIKGDCGTVTSKNGNIQIEGNVTGDVTSKNGNIFCRDVEGDVETKNGNVMKVR